DRALALVAAFASPHPLAELGAHAGHAVVLDVHRTLGEIRAIHGAVRASLDGGELAELAPFVEPQALWADQGLSPCGAHPPADLAGLGPVPARRLEHHLTPGPRWCLDPCGAWRGVERRLGHPSVPRSR